MPPREQHSLIRLHRGRENESFTALSPTPGLVSHTFLTSCLNCTVSCFSTATPADCSTAFAAIVKAVTVRLPSASQTRAMTAACISTTDQTMTCDVKNNNCATLPRPQKHVVSITRSQASSKTDQGVLQPKHKHDLQGTRTLPPISRRAVHSTCRHNVASTWKDRVPIRPHTPQRTVGKPTSLPPGTWTGMLYCGRFPSRQGRITSPSGALLGVAARSDAQPLDDAHDQCCCVRRPHAQVGRFDHLEKIAHKLLNDTALSQLHQHLRQCNGAQPQRAWLRHLLARFRLLRAAVQRGNRGRRPQPRRSVRDHRLGPNANPVMQNCRTTLGTSNRRNVGITPPTGPRFCSKHNPFGHTFNQIRRRRQEIRRRPLNRCRLHFDFRGPLCVCTNGKQ